MVFQGLFIDIQRRDTSKCTRYQQVYAAHCISMILWGENRWVPFERLWGIKDMRVIFSTMNNRTREVSQESLDDIEAIYPEYEREKV